MKLSAIDADSLHGPFPPVSFQGGGYFFDIAISLLSFFHIAGPVHNATEGSKETPEVVENTQSQNEVQVAMARAEAPGDWLSRDGCVDNAFRGLWLIMYKTIHKSRN